MREKEEGRQQRREGRKYTPDTNASGETTKLHFSCKIRT